MAVQGNRGINFKGGFDIKEIIDNQNKVIQGFIQVKKSAEQSGSNNKAADKSASQALQDALKQERLAREAINTQIAAGRLAQQQANAVAKEQAAIQKQIADQKRPTQVSNSQAEIDAYNRAQRGSVLYTSSIKAETVARAKNTQATAAQAIANNNLVLSGTSSVNSSNQLKNATQQLTRSKQDQARIDAINALRIKENTAALKNSVRESINERGSLEQRRAALIRLTSAYDRLGAEERKTAAGMRLGTIVKGLSEQIGTLEQATNRGQRSVGQYGGAFTDLKATLISAASAYVSLYAAINAGKAILHNNVELSDNFTDVQRTAKLSAEEVDRLGASLKELNTRTTLEGLLEIGFIGGRLGVAKEDLVGFIKQVDELAVVLKKEFPGGAEAVATSLGKIISVYKITQKEGITLEDALRKTGSAFLELSHNGGAPVQYLQEFALGTAGVAQVVKLGLPTLLAYGSVLSKAGINAGTAATNVTRFLSDLSTKREKYFAIAQLGDANLTLEKFTNLINTDSKQALEAFFKGLKAGNPTPTELSDRLKSLNLTAGKTKNTVIALSEAQDTLFRSAKLINKAYEEGTSVNHNFELANNSLAASFEKLKNKVSNIFTNSFASRQLASLLNSFTDTRSESEKLSEEFSNNKHRLDELDSSLKPLVARYDELKSKSKLSKDESEELRKVTAQIGNLLPGVTKAFDNYGNAIDINRSKIEKLTAAQRASLELQNRAAIKQANSDFNQAQSNVPDAKKVAQTLDKSTRNTYDKIYDFLYGGDRNAESQQASKDRLTRIAERSYQAAKAIRDLGGTLTKAQKDIINYYEVLNKPKKTEATITGDGTNTPDEADRTPEIIKAEIKALTAANLKLKVGSDELKKGVERLRELKKELKLALGGEDTTGIKSENAYQTALKKQRDIQGEIDALVKKGRAKQLSDDDQEIADVEAKYKKLRDKAIEFNNSKKSKGLKTDTSGLLFAQSTEEDAVKDKQESVRLKTSIDLQKGIYSDFEAYKTKIGEDEARKRFNNEIGSASDYLSYLNQQRNKLLGLDDTGKGATADGANNRKQLEVIDKEIALEVEAKKKRDRDVYANALQAAQTYTDRIRAIDFQYNEYRKALGDNASKDQLDRLKNDRDAAIRNANEENAVAKSGYADLMMQYDELTRGAIIKKLNIIKEGYRQEYREGKLNSEQLKSLVDNVNEQIGRLTGNNSFNKISASIKEYKAQVKELGKDSEGAAESESDMYAAISEGAADASSVVSELASAFGELGIGGDDLQDTLKNVSGALDGISGIAKGLATGNPVDIVTGSIKLLTSAIQLFNVKDKRLQKQINQYKEQLASLGTSFKQLERDAANAIGNDVYQDQAAQIENLRQQQILLTQARQAEMDKKKSDQSVIDDYTNQINDIPNQIDDINKAISQNLIQTNFRDFSNSLADAFADAFKSGEDSAKAFDNVFNNVIANAIKNSLKLSILDPIVAKFTSDLSKYARENGNSVIGFDFDSYKEQLKAAGELFNAGLKGSEQFFKDAGVTDVTNTLKGSIQASLTEDTGTILAGVFRGVQLTLINIEGILRLSSASNASMSSVATSTLNGIIAIQNNTLRTANNTDQLSRLEAVESSLNSIAKNTGDTIGLQLRAAGKFQY